MDFPQYFPVRRAANISYVRTLTSCLLEDYSISIVSPSNWFHWHTQCQRHPLVSGKHVQCFVYLPETIPEHADIWCTRRERTMALSYPRSPFPSLLICLGTSSRITRVLAENFLPRDTYILCTNRSNVPVLSFVIFLFRVDACILKFRLVAAWYNLMKKGVTTIFEIECSKLEISP